RQFRLFALADDETSPFYTVDAIHNERGFRDLRAALASMYDLARQEPDLQVVGANLAGDRTLKLRHTMQAGTPLDEATQDDVLRYVARLWGHKVELEAVKPTDDD
ncbi:MAG: SpoVR family protein, partial [Pseudomonadota bacterium]